MSYPSGSALGGRYIKVKLKGFVKVMKLSTSLHTEEAQYRLWVAIYHFVISMGIHLHPFAAKGLNLLLLVGLSR